MEEAELAIVDGDTDLHELLTVMRRSGHAAVAVRSETGLKVVTAGQVAATRRTRGFEAPRARDVGSQLLPAFLHGAAEAEQSWSLRPETLRGISYALSEGGNFAILRSTKDRVVVMTADTMLSESFNARITLCQCSGTQGPHVFVPEELADTPGLCPLDGQKVDCN